MPMSTPTTPTMRDVLETLASGGDLDASQARAAFEALMEGELSPGQAGAFLMGLRAKGETPVELAAGVAACVKRARLVPGISGPRIDTCGTGGDNTCSFNCSTTVALVLASMGHQVVKHGNRSVSSKCGSADVLEAMGVPLDTQPDDVAGVLERDRFVFLFAPGFHPAFRHVMPLRKELGIRTLFNLMGPLLNPARPTHQLLGVPDTSIMELVAECLAMSDVERAAVVHGAGGFDELTPFGPARVLHVEKGAVREDELDPAALGLGGGEPKDVSVSGPEESLRVLRELLAGSGPEVMRNMVALNVAMAVHLLEAIPLSEAADKAREALASGSAAKRFGSFGHA